MSVERVCKLDFAADGAACFQSVLSPIDRTRLEAALPVLQTGSPGQRLTGQSIAPLLSAGSPAGMIAASLLGPRARPVKAIVFNKSPHANWSLAWHQDRAIAVRERADVPGFTHWTRKNGIVHVEPPFELLERLVMLRIHLDPVPQHNAPLLIARGSHLDGCLREAVIPNILQRRPIFSCTAAVGDVWAYAAPILHASELARYTADRRVLQVHYAAEELPRPLEWLGV